MNNKPLLWTIITSSLLFCSFQSTVCKTHKKNSEAFNTQPDSALPTELSDTTQSTKKKRKRVSKRSKKSTINSQVDAINTTEQQGTSSKQPKKKRISLFGSKTIGEMSYEELIAYKKQCIEDKNLESAIKALEFALKLCAASNKNKDMSLLERHTIELADLYFDHGDLYKGEILYAEFSRLYPGSDQIEYAMYKAILSSFYQTLTIEHDQTKTHDTIALTNKFIERADLFKQFYPDVIKIRQQCEHKIVESEINIFNFYFKQGTVLSAQTRLNNIKKDWASKLPEIEPQLAALQQKIDTKKAETEKIILAQNNKKIQKNKKRKNKQDSTITIVDAQPKDTATATNTITLADAQGALSDSPHLSDDQKPKTAFIDKF